MKMKPNIEFYDTLQDMFRGSVANYKDNILASYSDGTDSFTYAAMEASCRKMDRLLNSYGIGHGGRVAVLAENMPEWITVFFAATAFGRVIVPILPDCSANEVHNILAHSQATAVFASARQMSKIDADRLPDLMLVADIEKLDDIAFGALPFECTPESEVIDSSELAAIIYTSGTSGNAKGVMLSHRNLCHNIVSAYNIEVARPDDVWMSILPMGHTLEMSLGMLYPFFAGARICYLRKSPTPAVLLKAFAQVRPTIMISVPLIIEKVYRRSVADKIAKSSVLSSMKRVCPRLLYRIVGAKLMKSFGGRLRFFGIGGAKLDSEVETFLKKAGFPYAIGYGMTECAPLICAAGLGKTRVGSTGAAVYGMDVKLVDVNPETGEGEIACKGPNVMMGYYKDPDRTASVFTPDGYLRTSDLAVLDAEGYIDIKGRSSNMILGASGENIYPEEIEMVIAGVEYVEASLVKSENGRLLALVKLIDGRKACEAEAKRILDAVNPMVNKASQLSQVRFVTEEFQKTATRKIRRFLYA